LTIVTINPGDASGLVFGVFDGDNIDSSLNYINRNICGLNAKNEFI